MKRSASHKLLGPRLRAALRRRLSLFCARRALVLGCFAALALTAVGFASWGRGGVGSRGVGRRGGWARTDLPEPSWEANGLLGHCRSGWVTRNFTVTSEPITLLYGQVKLGQLAPTRVPRVIAERFAGDIMPIVNSDLQVISGNDDMVPAYEGYLHHYSYGMGSEEDLRSAASSVGKKPMGYSVFYKGGNENRVVWEDSEIRRRLPRPYAYTSRSPEVVNIYAHLINLKKGEGGSWNGEFNELVECPCTKQRVIDVERGLIDGQCVGEHCAGYSGFGCNEALLAEGNPSCSLSTYKGGVLCCGDGVILLDTDKPGNEVDSLPSSTFRMKINVEYLDCQSPVDWSVGAGDLRMQKTEGKRFADEYVQSALQVPPMNKGAGWYNLYSPTNHINGAGNLTHYGNQDYDVPQCAPPNECVHVLEGLTHIVDRTRVDDFDKEVDLVYAYGHMHTGGISIELYHGRTNELICRSVPKYGDGVAPGNEKGYLVSANSCQFSHADPSLPTPPRLKLSDPMRVVARYDSTVARGAVMAMFTMQFADPPSGAL